jgi:hypothetical protein
MEAEHRKLAGMVIVIVCCLAFVARAARAQEQQYVWWEAEAFEQTNLPNPGAPFPGDITQGERDKLSAGTWLLTQGPESDTPYFATYQVAVPADKTWNFWVRKFWLHGPFRWRFDSGEWQTCGRDVALQDDTYLRKFIGANWIFLGQVPLAAGQHTLRIEMLGRTGGGAIDCFALVDGPFVPRGKLKPGETSGHADEGFFAWEPPADPLSDDCPIDLRYLNEAEAGQGGFVRREGSGFVLGSGEPVRFWLVQADGLMSMKDPMVDYWARRLAKYGVNIVRLGMLGMFNDHKNGDMDAFRRKLDRLHYVVAALRREGIYVYLGHLYWHTSVNVSEKDGFPGFGNGRSAIELLFFDPHMQDIYMSWARDLLTTPNPYTGRSLATEPAVAFVEVQNESSLFFWTFNPQGFVPYTRELIERRFGEWAATRYGSIAAALAEWGPEKSPSTIQEVSADRPGEGRLGLYSAGTLTNNDWARFQRNPKRASDQLRFMVESQRAFYDKAIGFLRDQVGCGNLMICSNWQTADPRTLGVLEHYTYLAGDAICRNVYYDVRYDPRPERFYAIDAGDTYADYSALKPPAMPSPLTIASMDDYPYMITENDWCRPNRFRVEWPFLVATYAAMMGVDGWSFFSLDNAMWSSQMSVWEVNCPSVLGQFPAAALIFRKGYVSEAPAAVTDRMTLDQLYESTPAALFELSGSDALWESRIGDLEGATDREAMNVDRLAFFVGKVDRELTDGPTGVETVPLADYIDHGRKLVRSLTGQLRWDYGNGVVTVDTPYAQGACGFLKAAGPLTLGDVTIESGNEYGAILVVSLDGRPLAESQRVLVQAGTEDWPYGFATQPAGDEKRIVSLGGYPPNVRKVDAGVTLRNAAVTGAAVLDGNGYITGREAESTRRGDGLAIALPEDSLYTLVR